MPKSFHSSKSFHVRIGTKDEKLTDFLSIQNNASNAIRISLYYFIEKFGMVDVSDLEKFSIQNILETK